LGCWHLQSQGINGVYIQVDAALIANLIRLGERRPPTK
jgi:hypothetical protein